MKPIGMIDIGSKKPTLRIAKARCEVLLNEEIIEMIRTKTLPKGDVLEFARVAGIMGAKMTPRLIPLCHPLEIEQVSVDYKIEKNRVIIETLARTTAKTGVEMEAMTAAHLAALTIYDMCKMFSKYIEISNSYLVEKSGGKSGHFVR